MVQCGGAVLERGMGWAQEGGAGPQDWGQPALQLLPMRHIARHGSMAAELLQCTRAFLLVSHLPEEARLVPFASESPGELQPPRFHSGIFIACILGAFQTHLSSTKLI